MRAFSKPNSTRRQSSCSTGDTDHQVNERPHAERDWALKQGIIPLNSVITKSWYKRPNYWSDWYKQAETAGSKDWAARASQTKRTASTTPVSAACGSTSHKRRSCDKMTAFMLSARRPTRTGVEWPINGLLTMVSMRLRYQGQRTQLEWRWKGDVALITSINLDEITL